LVKGEYPRPIHCFDPQAESQDRQR
jgi:hypothetical protein